MALLETNGQDYTPGRILGPDGQPIRDRPPLLDAAGYPLLGSDGYLLPHPRTFSAIYNAISRTYRYTWDEAVKHLPKNALAMRRDVSIMKMLRERMYPVAQMEWSLETDDGEDETQKAVADKYTKIIKSTPRFQQMRFYLQEAVWYGRYGSQFVLGPTPIDGEMMNAVIKHQPINGDKIQFNWSGTPAIYVHAGFLANLPMNYVIPEGQGIQGIYTDRAPALLLGDPAWRARFVIHKHEVDDADYFEGEMAGGLHGVGIRSRVYWAWWIRQEMLSWLVDFLERVGQGLTVFTYDIGNPQSKTAAEKAAQQQGRNAVIAWPRWTDGSKSGSGVERIETSTASGDLIQGAMAYFDDMMREYIVGQSMSSKTEATGIGGDAQAELKADTKYRIIKFDCDNADQTLTDDFLKPLIDANDPGLPFTLRFKSHVDKPNSKDRMDGIKIAWETGVEIKTDEIRDAAGLSKPSEDDEVVTNEAAGLPPAPPGNGAAPSKVSPSSGGSPSRKRRVQLPELLGAYPQRGERLQVPTRNEKTGNDTLDPPSTTDTIRTVPDNLPNAALEEIPWQGLTLVIEYPADTYRTGKDDNGEEWTCLSKFAYGYIQDSPQAGDDNHVDCYLGPDLNAPKVWIVDQLKGDGSYDEPKCMIGFGSKAEAIQGYLANYPADWDRFGGTTKFKVADFLDWLKAGDIGPLREHKRGKPKRYDAAFESKHPRDDIGKFTTTLASGQTVSFVPHEKQGKSETTVMVDTQKIESGFVKDHPDYYIPPGGGGGEILGRIAEFKKFLETGKPVQASRVHYDPETKTLSFIDGRHRFVTLRDLGAKQVAVTIEKSQAKHFYKPGTPLRYQDGKITRDSFNYEQRPPDAPHRCGNCGFMQGISTCLLYQELGKNLPKAFRLNSQVEPDYGCDAWKAPQ
jgi:hypothetical protein